MNEDGLIVRIGQWKLLEPATRKAVTSLMRARAGDPPRTMPQKVLAGRAADPSLSSDEVHVKVDQVILSRMPSLPLAEALSFGLKKTPVEVAVAYDGDCITDALSRKAKTEGAHQTLPPEALLHGLLIGRAGVGFPAALHLERFASPARLAVTDDPRMAFVGGIGLLSFVLPSGQLASALAKGMVCLRRPRSVQILLSGRTRPFVCARDVSLELMRMGLSDVVRRIDSQYGDPVVLEFAGPSAKLLSVPDRAILCAIAPAVGAASAVFVSDEKSETYLRDQRRSKAHRALVPDAGAPCDDVVSLDLATVDPLLLDAQGQVRPVRDLAGTPVHQVVLGGDSGTCLRDMLAAAALLKSKRVSPRLDFLVAPPTRQVLEVLASTGALADLIATGARLIEPDHRVLSGEIYPPGPNEVSMRTFDPEPRPHVDCPFLVASSETLAYAVASGQVGDPRSFKRPVRVTVPRVFPTEDVLITRYRKSTLALIGKKLKVAPANPVGLDQSTELIIHRQFPNEKPNTPFAIVADNNDDVRRAVALALPWAGVLKAVVAQYIPSDTAAWLGGTGIAALQATEKQLARLSEGSTLTLPAPKQWSKEGVVPAKVDKISLELQWLGRAWELQALETGVSRPPAKVSR